MLIKHNPESRTVHLVAVRSALILKGLGFFFNETIQLTHY